jgi:hypothetical protein
MESLLTSLHGAELYAVCPRLSALEGSWQNIEQATTDRWKGAVPKLIAWERRQQVLIRHISTLQIITRGLIRDSTNDFRMNE